MSAGGPPPRETVDATVPTQELPASSVIVEVDGTARRLDVAEGGELVLGRDADAHVVVEDERVSRRHLRFALRHGRLTAEDLGSRNGTTLNGRRLSRERRLRGGDVLQAGPVVVSIGGPRPPAELLDEGDLIDRLDEELERARLFRRPLGVVGLALDGDATALPAATAALVARRGRADVIGEYADRHLLLLLPERDRAAAAREAGDAAAVASVLGVGVAARSAAFPEDGVTADELIDVALRAQAPVADAGAQPVVVDEATRAAFEAARRAGRSGATVLVTGESGVGKEWIAGEVHRASARAAGPLEVLNCAALPESLAEAELFGHERGAFTGADRRRVGRLQAAHGGTLFLDEIGELSLNLQAKLLRVLEDRQVRPIGAAQAVAVDVRFVAATNRDLEREVAARRFRQDLYYRLCAITIVVPPLRERPGDLQALTQRFVAQAARVAGRRPPAVSRAFMAALMAYPWPGNVRELRNVIERAVVLGDGDELSVRHLPERLTAADGPGDPDGPMRRQMDDVERRAIEQALAETGGNRTHAARKLGISRRGLIYKLHKHKLIEPA